MAFGASGCFKYWANKVWDIKWTSKVLCSEVIYKFYVCLDWSSQFCKYLPWGFSRYCKNKVLIDLKCAVGLNNFFTFVVRFPHCLTLGVTILWDYNCSLWPTSQHSHTSLIQALNSWHVSLPIWTACGQLKRKLWKKLNKGAIFHNTL